jgi:hypothetical protein
MSFYCMGKDYNDLKLSRWATISRSTTDNAIHAYEIDCALLSLLYPTRIITPLSILSQSPDIFLLAA